jgi:predicted transcriptional regulator
MPDAASTPKVLDVDTHIELTADIVSAYVSKNPVPAADLAALISQVHVALANISGDHKQQDAEPLKPAVPVKKSVSENYIVCLEDGKKFKSLKRHLATHHNLTPEEYRAKWGLSADYPMVAPAYAASRSVLAKQMGLGRKPRAEPEQAKAPAKRGRKPKAA